MNEARKEEELELKAEESTVLNEQVVDDPKTGEERRYISATYTMDKMLKEEATKHGYLRHVELPTCPHTEFDLYCNRTLPVLKPTPTSKVKKNIVFIKTPKCGSTTIGGVVRQVADHYGMYGPSSHMPFVDSPAFDKAFNQDLVASKVDPKKSSMFWSVHGPLRGRLLALMGPDPYLMTVVRNPTDRTLSAYYYWGISAGFKSVPDYALFRASNKEAKRWKLFHYIRGEMDHPRSTVCQYDSLMLTNKMAGRWGCLWRLIKLIFFVCVVLLILPCIYTSLPNNTKLPCFYNLIQSNLCNTYRIRYPSSRFLSFAFERCSL